MTRRDEIIRMAREAANGETVSGCLSNRLTAAAWTPFFERFAALVAAAERERCAKVCDESEIPFDISVWINSTKQQMTGNVAHALADMIRALKDGEE